MPSSADENHARRVVADAERHERAQDEAAGEPECQQRARPGRACPPSVDGIAARACANSEQPGGGQQRRRPCRSGWPASACATRRPRRTTTPATAAAIMRTSVGGSTAMSVMPMKRLRDGGEAVAHVQRARNQLVLHHLAQPEVAWSKWRSCRCRGHRRSWRRSRRRPVRRRGGRRSGVSGRLRAWMTQSAMNATRQDAESDEQRCNHSRPPLEFAGRRIYHARNSVARIPMTSLVFKFDMIQTVALAAVLLFVGYGIRRRIGVLDSLQHPGAGDRRLPLRRRWRLALRQSGVFAFEFDTTLQTPFMIAFFTSIGLGASLGAAEGRRAAGGGVLGPRLAARGGAVRRRCRARLAARDRSAPRPPRRARSR